MAVVPNCGCPQGYDPPYVLQGDVCVQITTTEPTQPYPIYPVCNGNKSQYFGDFGTRFYDLVSGPATNLPIKVNPTATELVYQNNTVLGHPDNLPGSNLLWGGGIALNGRLNDVGVWACQGSSNLRSITITATIGSNLVTSLPGTFAKCDEGNFILPNCALFPGFEMILEVVNSFTIKLDKIATASGTCNINLQPCTVNCPTGTVVGCPLNEWIGFSSCITLTEDKVYYIGIGGDNRVRLNLTNSQYPGLGQKIFNFDQSTLLSAFSFRYWHVIPILLKAGPNILHIEGLNNESVAAFGAEIYDVASPAALMAITTIAGLDAVTIFSTKDKIGQNFDTGQISGYQCTIGSLSCGNDPVCTLIQSSPPSCCFQLMNCKAPFNTITTNTDLSSLVTKVIKISGYTECWVVSEGPCNINSIPIIVVSPLNGYASCELCDPPTCWTITECGVPSNTLNIINDLSQYAVVGVSIQISSYGNTCWQVTESLNCNLSISLPSGFTILRFPETGTVLDPCLLCDPICYDLTACLPFNTHAPIKVTTDLSLDVGNVVKIDAEGFEDLCWTVSVALNCTGSIGYIPLLSSFADCYTCHPTTAYILTDCNTENPHPDSPFTVSTNLFALIGKTINQVVIEGFDIDPATCWNVTELGDFDGGFEATYNPEFYQDCECCLPKPPDPPKPPPVKIIPDPVRIFYRIEESDCEIKANQNFAGAYEKLVKKLRFGISSCCVGINFSSIWIKKQLSDLGTLIDPNYCPQQINACFPNPCNTISTCCQPTKCTTCSPCKSCSPGFSQFPCQAPTTPFPGQMCYTNVLIPDFIPCSPTPETLNQFTFNIGGVILNTPVFLDCSLSQDLIQDAITGSLLDSSTSTVIITSFDSNGANFFIQKTYTTLQDQTTGCVDMDTISTCSSMLCSLLNPSCGSPLPETNFLLWNGVDDFFITDESGGFIKIF